MAVEVDPLVLEIRADLKQYRAQLQSTTSLVTSSLGRQEGAIQNLERQMQRSSGAISNSLGSIAGALAGAFSVQQIGALIDNFTRLQNSLRVSGLEGQNLANVQSQLLDLSARYGVSINELADLYGKSSQAASDLGASEAQLVQITEASAQALKITGTSAVAARGALLGLTQALSSGIVRAEEFNQINEGGLRPLLQVAANTERFGGSVAKLRSAVVEGTVTSKEFYQAILNGSAELEGKANKATLTLAGAFTALASQLSVYVGEASASNGVTAALAAGIGALANNLDKIIPALATIGAVIGVKYVAGLVAATVASTGLKVASIGLAATLNGTTAAATKTALAMNALSRTVPFLAVTALVIGLGNLVTESNDATRSIEGLTNAADQAEAEAENMEARLKAAGVELNNVAGSGKNAADGINATKRAAEQAQKRLKDLEDQAGITALKLNQLRLSEAQDKRRATLARTSQNIQANAMGRFANTPGLIAAQENQAALLGPIDREIAALRRQRDALIEGIKAGINVSTDPKETPLATTGAGTSSAGRAGGVSRGASGPSAEELLFRSDSEQRRLDAEILQAKAQLAVNAKDREDFEKQILELEKAQRVADLAQTTGLSEDQRKAQQAVIDELYGTSAELDAQGNIVAEARPSLLALQINRDSLAQQTQESADAAELEKQILLENLGIQYDLATSIKQRRKIALDIVNAEFNTRIASLEEAKLQSGISAAKRKQLDAEIALTKIRQGRAQTDAKNANLSPSAQYLKDINELDFGDETEKFGVDALKDLNRGLADAIVNGGNLGDVLEDTGKRFLAQLIELTFQLLVIKPLLESLGGGIGGAVGGFFSLFGGKSRASGGPVSAGQVYRVNEGTRPEYFRPNTGGDIIPLSKMKATPNAQGGGVSVVRLELSGDIDARIQSQSAQVAVEVVRAAAPSIVDAGAAKAQRDMGRPRL
jgi:tape measure domain-containing protein